MRQLKIAGLIAAFVIGSAGVASAQVDNCSGNGFAGTAIGAVVGGTTGGLIANNTRGFQGRGFRGNGFNSVGFGRAGFGRSGFNRFGGRSGFGFRGRNGNGALGAVIGAVVGGIAGNQIAAANQRNCINKLRQAQQVAHPQGYSSGGAPIDHNARRLGDPYGGQSIPVAPSQHTGYAHPAPQQSSIVTQPIVRAAEFCTRTDPHIHNEPGIVHPVPAGGSFPITTQHDPVVSQPGPIISSPSPVITQPEPLAGGNGPVCQIVDRRTTLPDGTIVSEPIEYCQFSSGGDWVPR